MDLEEAASAGGDTASLRDKIVKNFSPAQIEQLRAKLYEASSAGSHQANRFLSALPTRGAAGSTPGGMRGAAGTRDPDAPSPALTAPVPKTYGEGAKDIAMGAHRALDRAFPTDKGFADAAKNDPLTNGAVQTALLAPLMGPAASTLGRVAEGAGEFVGGGGGTVAKGLTKVAGGAGMGAGASALTGGDPKAGAIMGGLMAVPGGALDAMHDSRLPTSDIIAATKAAGGKIGFGGAGDLRAPETQNLPPGARGETELGVRGQQTLLGDMERRMQANKDAIAAGEESAIARHGDTPVDTTKIREKVQSVAQSRMRDDGMALDPQLVKEALDIDRALTRPGVPGVRVLGGARGAPGTEAGHEPLNPHGGDAGRAPAPESHSPLSVRGGEPGGRSSGVRYDGQGRMILPTEEVSSGAGARGAGGELIPGSPGVPTGTGASPGGGRFVLGAEPVISGRGATYEPVPGKPLNEISLREAIALKKSLRDRADFGGPSTPEARAARAVSGELSDIGHGSDPAYDEALTRYATESTKLERANDVFGGRKTQELPDQASVERGMQKRIGELGRDPYLTRQALEVAKENPEWGDLVNSVIARNGLKLRLGGSVPGSTLRTVAGNAQALALRMSPLGRASNLNYPAIPLEVAAVEGAKKRKKDSEKVKSRSTFLDTSSGE